MQAMMTLIFMAALQLAVAQRPASLEDPPVYPPGPPGAGGPPPYMINPFVNEKCWNGLVKKIGEMNPSIEDPKEVIKMCDGLDTNLPQECQDADNKAVFECACAFLNDNEFMDPMLKGPSHIQTVVEDVLGEKLTNQSINCFYKQDSTKCAASQAKGLSELKRCKESGDYYKITRGIVSKYPSPWSMHGTAEVCLPQKCVSLVPKFVQFVEEQAKAAKSGGAGGPPHGLMAPVTFVARRLAETHSQKIVAPAFPIAPLKPLALVAEPLRRQISSADQPSGRSSGMPFDPSGTCPPPALDTDDNVQKSCSMDRKNCTDLEKKIVQCACGFGTDTDFVKATKNMSVIGEEVAKQIECLANNFATPDDCKSVTSPTIEELSKCKTGGKKDWGYCVTGNGFVADFPGEWLTTKWSSMTGVCLPNACHELLTGNEMMQLLEKALQAEKEQLLQARADMEEHSIERHETDKEIAAADDFLKHCKGGQCKLPIRCGSNADQDFLDDMGSLIDPANVEQSRSPSPTPANNGASRNWIMPLVTCILVVVVAGGAAFFVFNKNKGPAPQVNPSTELGTV